MPSWHVPSKITIDVHYNIRGDDWHTRAVADQTGVTHAGYGETALDAVHDVIDKLWNADGYWDRKCPPTAPNSQTKKSESSAD